MYPGAPNTFLEQDLSPLPVKGLEVDKGWHSGHCSPFSSDPYPAETVVRGVPLSHCGHDFDGGFPLNVAGYGEHDYGSRDIGAKDRASMPWDGHCWSGEPMSQDITSVSDAPKFTDSAPVMELAKESQTNTCVFLKGASAAEIARFAQKLLTEEYRAKITKVRETKFAIKATVFDEVGHCSSHCALKIRVFKAPRSADEEEQGLIVQIRRNKGDALVFNHIFRKVSRRLQKHADMLRTGIRAPNDVMPISKKLDFPALPALPTIPMPESAVQPLLDMMVDTAWPAGQVEAMIGLVTVMASANAAVVSVISKVLRSKHDVFKALHDSPEFEVSYPAKLLASQLNH